MLVCIEVIGLSSGTCKVVNSRGDRVSISYVTIDAIDSSNLDFNLFIEIVFRYASESPGAYIIFSEC